MSRADLPTSDLNERLLRIQRMLRIRWGLASLAELGVSMEKASAALNRFAKTSKEQDMELRKLKEEKAALELRLEEVIRAEIDKFTAAGGPHPCDIQVGLGERHSIGCSPEHYVSRVFVNFGL